MKRKRGGNSMKETKKRKEKKIEKGMGVGDLRVKLVTSREVEE